MKYIDLKHNTIDESQIDLSKGSLSPIMIIKKDAEPIDNVVKFAYTTDDYEEVYMYIPNKEVEPSQLDRIEAQIAYTAMMTDTLLED